MVERMLVKPVAFSCLLFAAFPSAHANNVEDSVVRIITHENAATGFVWEGKRGKYIATSLHTLAGASAIYYDKLHPRFELEVYRIDKESDLALLRAKSGEITLPALQLGDIQPIQDRRYYIYGYPAGVLRVQGDSVEFSRTKHNLPMRDVLSNQIVREVTASGYPKPTVKLLSVSSPLTPGHSGAPIIDTEENNKVIGIAAGGLSRIGYARVDWAFPALTYLPILEEHGVLESTANMSISKNDRRFSMRTEQAAPPLESATVKYYHVGRIPLDDLLEGVDDSVSPGDPWFGQDGLDYVKRTAKDKNFDLKAPINIYQNMQTGDMVYIPAAIPRASITMKGDNMLVVNGGRTWMYLQIIERDSFRDALLSKDNFITILDQKYGTDGWPIDTESEWNDDEPTHDSKGGYWAFSIVKYKPGPEEPLNDADISLRISYDDKQKYSKFLGVAIIGRDYEKWIDGPDDEMEFLIDSCGWVSGLTYRYPPR